VPECGHALRAHLKRGAGRSIALRPRSIHSSTARNAYLVIGFAAGEIPKIPLNLTLLKGCDVLGVFWGMATQRDPKHANGILREIARMISDGRLHPDVSAKYPLAEGRKAIRMLMDRKAMGKVIVTM
jgi:NADPH2:quinone reductase